MAKKLIYLASIIAVLTMAGGARAGLIGYWAFDDGSGTRAQDGSPNKNHGTLMGNPQWVPGKVGMALKFDGVDDWVEVPHAAVLTVNKEVTVAAWINTSRYTGGPGGGEWQAILAKSNDPRSYSFYTYTDGTLHFSTTSGGAYVGSNSTGIVPLNEWVHVAAMVVGGTHRYYINGQPAGEGGGGIVLPGSADTASVMIGVTHEGSNEFLGMIDEVRIYNRALTPNQVLDLFNGIAPAWLEAQEPNPADGKTGVTMGLLTWTAGDTAVYHDVYFGTNPTLGAAEFKVRTGYLFYWYGVFTPGTTYYWRIDEVEGDSVTIHTGNVWSFTAQPLTAWNPKPPNGATNVLPAVQLSWSAGQNVTKHHLYFGDSFSDVDSGAGGTDKGELALAVTTYNTGPLYPETTYYWRVDESDGTIWRKGETWSFATPAGGSGVMREWWLNIGGGTTIPDLTGNANYPDNPTARETLDIFEGPVDWADNYGSRLYGWLMPPESGDYTFWIATDDAGQLSLSTDADPANKVTIASVSGWVPSRDFDNTGGGTGGASQKSAAISLVKGKAYYIEALMKEGGGGDNIAVAWQGGPVTSRQVISGGYVSLAPFAPIKAYGATPADKATDVTDTPTLRWTAGQKAATHNVYFGTDATAVANATTASTGIYRGQQNLAATSYAPTEAPLQWNKTYYWRIDEVNPAEPDGPWKGIVWSFTTANFIVVDDFESYTDDVGSRIFQTWKDGWGYNEPPPGYGGNGTGSAVGYSQPPFAEPSIVHGGGGQSMPLGYDNSGATGKARYSETFREWTSPQNWTRNNVKALTLYFYGALDNAAAQLYVALEDNAAHVKVVNYPDPEAVQAAGWQEWNIELSQFSAAGVNLAAVKKMYIGLGNRASPTLGGTGTIYIDDIRVYPSRCVPSMGTPAADLSGNCVVDAADVDILANLWLDTGFQVTPADPGTTGLVAYYPFNGNANDTVGGHNGTIVGTPTYATGKIGQAIQLNGVDQMVDVGSVGISGAAPRTVSGWAKSNSTAMPDWTNIFGFTGTDDANLTARSFDIELRGGQLQFCLHVYGWEDNILPLDLDWHHLAATYDGTTIRWYGDGRYINSYERSGTNALNTEDTVHMGQRGDTGEAVNFFPGKVDDVKIWNRALTGAQIAWLAGLTSTFSIPADLRQDNVINFKDFAVLADSWLEQVLWP
jgi:hypothetical protein